MSSVKKNIGPEIELLLLCARTQMSDERAERLAALAAGRLDWDVMHNAATRHGLMPLVYQHLNRVCPAAVPSHVLGKLRDYQRRIAALNIFLAEELASLVRTLEAQAIPVIAWKGPTLALAGYGDLSLRQFCDLDLIVRRTDVPRAADIMEASGYQLTPALSKAQQKFMLRTGCNLPFTRYERRLIVELHWAVAARNFSQPFAPEVFLEHYRETVVNGTSIKTLLPEDLLLSLCVHGAKHLWERLSWLADVSELIAAEKNLNWQQLISSARHSGCERLLFLGLRLAQELLGVALPPEVEKAIELEPGVKALADERSARLLMEDGQRHGVPGLWSQIIFQLKARRRIKDKLRYLRFVVSPTDEDLRLFNLPQPLTPFYYLLRPARMLITGGPRREKQELGVRIQELGVKIEDVE